MLIVRRLLQVAFALVAAAVAFITIKAPDGRLATHLAFIVFFILIILLLGPWWPSSDKIGKWKLNLPTDNHKIAFPLAGAVLGVYALFQAWDIYARPNQDFRRFEIPIAAYFGAEGVAWAWVAIGVGCFWGAWRLHRRGRAPDKKCGLTPRSMRTRATCRRMRATALRAPVTGHVRPHELREYHPATRWRKS